jgi:hypothetical protein
MGYAGILLYILLTVFDGTLLTYVYSKNMPSAVRLCVGACTGFALLASMGFAAASFVGGLNPLIVWACLFVLTVASLALMQVFHPQARHEVIQSLREVQQAILHPNRRSAGLVAFYAVAVVGLGLVFHKAVFVGPEGMFTGVLNNLGDLPFHLQIISSFSQGHNYPPQDPGFAGVRFAYPFLVDFLAAMLTQTGASMLTAIWFENMVLALALLGLMHYWTLQLTRERLAGYLAPVLILFSGGLGWWLLLQDTRNSDSGFLGLLPHLPHRYTIGTDALWRWGNSFTTLFIPQRSILMGVPLAIVILLFWWQTLNPEKNESEADNEEASTPEDGNRRMLAAGCLAGLLPLIHAHTYIVLMGTAACLVLLFPRWRAWAHFFLPAVLVAVPEMLWAMHGSAVRTHTFWGWFLGWDKGDANALWFWFVNTGAFIPLLLVAILWRSQGKNLVPPALLRFYLPFLLWFIAPNVIKFAPWGWDNIKVLFYWYLASVPLVALLLASWLKSPGKIRWAAAGLLVSLTLAGALDLVRVVTGTEDNLEFDPDGVAIARQLEQFSAPRALVLHDPTYNTPVFLTGRRSLLGYPGQAWSRGLDYIGRQTDIRQIYSGSPQATALLQQYQIGYVLVGPQERGDMTVNDSFWNQFPVVAQAGNYRVFKVEPSR